MDAYQDSIQSRPRSGYTVPSRSESQSPAPSPSDLVQWKEESDRFLHDVRRRLDDILSKLETNQTVSPNPSLEQPVPPEQPAPTAPRDSAPENHSTTADAPSLPTGNEDDRISALKAQLARKLLSLEEAADGSSNFQNGNFQNGNVQSGNVQSGAEVER